MSGPPNIVFIITDNQSPWTLGCYGNSEILTPNTDRLAREGIQFTNSYCSNPVCSPNRATYMTGLIPSQHGVHNWLGFEKPDAQMGPDAYCTIGEFVTLPQILANKGYTCGLSGKWHLGDSLNPQLGFSYWFTRPQGHTRSFYNSKAIWEGKVYEEPRYSIDAITDHAVDFMKQSGEKPFFLYVGYNGPYGLDTDLRTVHKNRHTEYYADKELKCFPREEPHPWLKANLDVINNETAMRNYAAAVSGVDDGVGKLMEALAELGIEDNTLVVFTADHGLCGGHHGMWGMGDHSWPFHMFEESLRIPLILRHPGQILQNTTCETLTCNYDFFPSMLDYLELEKHIPDSPELPGSSYAGSLDGKDIGRNEEIMFHEYENTRAVRTREWKLVRRHPDGPDELYDMTNDPGERNNIVEDERSADIRRELTSRMEKFFGRYADPQYDMWRGGRNKAGNMTDAMRQRS